MNNFKMLLKIFRVHHWIKNLLLFIPLITAHKFYNLELILMLCVAFISFSFCASSIYIFNDILDIENDKAHPNKKNRPFASSKISIKFGIILGITSLTISFILSFNLNELFTIFLFSYLALSILYSFFLKKVKYLDCIILVGFYVLRIFSGGAVVNTMPSFWLIIFSFFIFMSLAFVKRYIELNVHYSENGNIKIPGRGYDSNDIKKLYFLGVASGYVSVLVLAFYIGSETVARLYNTALFIWLAIPLLFIWITVVWKKSKAKKIDDDPIVFSIKDKTSVTIAFLFFLCFILAKFIEL